MFSDKINLENLSNKLLYFLSQKSSRFKYCLALLFSISLFVLWLLLLVRPLNTRLLISKAKLKQLNNIKNSCSQSYDQCTDLTQKIEYLNTKINKNLSMLGSSSAYMSLGKVIECINCNGVTLINYSPGKVEKIKSSTQIQEVGLDELKDQSFAKTSKPDFGKKVSFELILEGAYLNVFNFFKCLSAIKYCLKFNSISIIKNEQGLIRCKLLLDIFQVSK